MPTLEIYFFGLICFYGDSSRRDGDRRTKKVAKLIHDEKHAKLIYLNNNQHDVLVPNDEIDFGTAGTAAVLDSFRRYVPHLSDLTIDDTTLNFKTHGAVVTLPGGILAAVDWYDNQGHYELGAEITSDDCISRLTLLQFDAPEPNVSVTYGDISHEMPSDGWVLIANVETSHDTTHPEPGHQMQRKDFRTTHRPILVPPDESRLARLYEVGSPCEKNQIDPGVHAQHLGEILKILKKHHSRVALHPECSNTQWP